MRTRRMLVLALVVAVVAGACGRSEEAERSEDLAAQVASFDVVAKRPGRFMVGLFSADRSRLVAFGTVKLDFAYRGTKDRPVEEPRRGPSAIAGFLPIPGQRLAPGAPGPRLVEGSEAVGVYAARDVSFDEPGFWEVTATASIEGKEHRATAAFQVLSRSVIPAVGDPAPRTNSPLAGAPGVAPKAIDSRAQGDQPIPDPELHSTTVAAAVAARRPVMVVISTPTYCKSRFCGPITETVSDLAKRHGERMAFVHLEVWEDFEAQRVNKAAAEWIFPPGTEDPGEPWVFVVGPDGLITHRFDNVASEAELEAAVRETLS